jgi:ribonuclease HII
MQRAIFNLPVNPSKIIIDGIHVPENLNNAEAIIKGDETCQEIAAASIVAKYFRDQLMIKYAKYFDGYALEKNKGYPTKDHKNAINFLGYTNIHRKSFKI